MKITKKHLCNLPFCYAVSHIKQDGRIKFILAPDDVGPCYSIDSETLEQQTVWKAPGGTMSLVPLPGEKGDFLASQRFFPGFNASDSEIVYAQYQDGTWQVRPWLKLPYVHRFDILERNGVYYLICCTLSTTKKNTEDWSSPGKLYVAELSAGFTKPVELTPIAEGMTRNHGYCRIQTAGFTAALTACDEGVFKLLPPARKGEAWTVRRILNKRVSDIAVCDIDGDGLAELATIEPFHGTDFVVYHQTPEGYIPIYRYPGKMAFCHVVWGGKLRGEAAFIGGCRAINQELFLLRWRDGAIVAETIETGKGPSNVEVINGKTEDLIVVANRESGEGTVYMVQSD